MEIVQSGAVLELLFRGGPPVRARARLRGAVLRSGRLGGAAGCGWVLEARLEDAAGEPRLAGRWLPAGCGGCPPAAFTAARAKG